MTAYAPQHVAHAHAHTHEPSRDCLAFSVVWVMDKEAHIQGVWFYRSVIHSKAALAYKEAQLRADQLRPR